MLLRIEDIDGGRCRPEAVDGIREDLEWLGVPWDGEVVFQSQRLGLYALTLERLKALGLVYPCFCSRKDIAEASSAPHGPDGPDYPGTCRALTDKERTERTERGELFALRLDCGRAFASVGSLTWTDRGLGRTEIEAGTLGDFVVARKDAPVSYTLCVVVDDADQGVTLVTRGDDLVPATAAQRLLQAVLALPEPEYHHHAVITGPDGRRLSKRDRSVTVQSLREAGASAEEVRRLARCPT